MAAIEKERMLEFRGQQLAGSDGEDIGRVEEIYLDADSGEPEWALVHTGLFGSKRTFVPLADATEADGRLRVPHDKATVKDAPQVEPDGLLSKDEEAALYRHYGLESSGGV
jgi:sporulation protein YlmC with PRC-barrel domain